MGNPIDMTPSTAPEGPREGEAMKPTILAFHGSGSNAMVHTVQLARLNRVIGDEFNLESMEAPFPSQAGPGVLPFFNGCGPFKRWLNKTVTVSDMKAGASTNAMSTEVEDLVRSTVHRIRSSGGSVVGLIGFSQGTKVVAGLLKGGEIARALKEKGVAEAEDLDWCSWKFGISVCGSYPPPLLPPSVSSALSSFSLLEKAQQDELLQSKITTPTFHVQGNQDEWKWAGDALIEGFYETGEGKSVVREWDMGHYYPTLPQESEEIAEWIRGVMAR